MTPTTHPLSHGEALDRVMRVIDLIAARTDLSDDDVAATLRHGGIGDVDAELLVAFVPCAFAFALLKSIGLSNFPSTFRVYSAARKLVELPLAEEHYFTVPLGVGSAVTVQGYRQRISKETFKAVVSRSAEMAVVNKFLWAGHTIEDLKGGTFAPPTLDRVTAEQIAASR